MSKKFKHWYKARPYTHLSKKLHKDHYGFVKQYVANPELVSKHAFYPLIHMRKTQRKCKQDNGLIRFVNKDRDIYYATHLDAHIYSYYANKVLGRLYENELAKDKTFFHCVSAYRRIPVNDSDRHKSNVHFAKDVFDFIKIKKECVAMTFDITKFFDNLDHSLIKKRWCELLGVDKLPADHFNVYKSITKFSFVEMGNPTKMKGLLSIFNIPHLNELKRNEVNCFCDDPKEFREKVVLGKLIRRNVEKDGELKKYGIPQGTPISAFLANLYLIEFDRLLYDLVQKKYNGLYRRYSDDIVIVCDIKNRDEIENIILNEITNYKLEIQKAKTKVWTFNVNSIDNSIYVRQVINNVPYVRNFQYLGFEFDGTRVLLKSSSLAKYYRSFKQMIRRKAKRASYYNNIYDPTKSRIYRNRIYKRFTHFGMKCKKKNYINYAMIAAKVMNDDGIRKQVSGSWNNIQKELNKYEIKYNLNK